MIHLLDEFVSAAADACPDKEALVSGGARLCYAELENSISEVANGLVHYGLNRRDRVAIYLPKTPENVLAMFGTARAGGVFVPVNPVLKTRQVEHILRDAGARFLVTTPDRLAMLEDHLQSCPDLSLIILTNDGPMDLPRQQPYNVLRWRDLFIGKFTARHRVIDLDIAAILYTSGSTGNPKGVVLSHRNMVAGAQSVAMYLESRRSDRLLAVLPFSFDVGFSQLSIAFCTVATVVTHEFFLPHDVVKCVENERISAITGVPPLWMQLADIEWPKNAGDSVSYFANTGGKMPRSLLERLRAIFPAAKPYLMYGLTEAFRSTYLPPEEVDDRPDSIGKAIPNAEILVVGENGKICSHGESGELVHRGALVSMGYWNDPEKTARRFKPAPGDERRGLHRELAVWSGDIVRMDDDGYLYFIGRSDGLIKTSGYRVSPTEVEEAAFASTLVAEAAAIGVDDERLGQRIVLVATPAKGHGRDSDAVLSFMKQSLPAFMTPAIIDWRISLPRTPNGKIDRKSIEGELLEARRTSTKEL